VAPAYVVALCMDQLDRLLGPDNPSVMLATPRRAASAVGRTLRIELK
jgi:antitoxin HicB